MLVDLIVRINFNKVTNDREAYQNNNIDKQEPSSANIYHHYFFTNNKALHIKLVQKRKKNESEILHRLHTHYYSNSKF